MKHIVLPFVFVCCFGGVAFAQSLPDSLMDEYIRTYQRDYALYSANARQVIQDNITAKNWAMVSQTITFMDSLMGEDKDDWLSPSERFLIHWIRSDLSYCTSLDQLSIVLNRSTFYTYQYFPQDYFTRASLSVFLVEYIAGHRDSLIQRLQQRALSADTTQFLELFSQALLQNTTEYALDQTRLNDSATRYIQTYPESPFIPVIKEHIRRQYQYTGFAWGGTVGVGYSFLSKTISEYFPTHVQFAFRGDLIFEPWLIFGAAVFSFEGQPDQAPFIDHQQWPTATDYGFKEFSVSCGYRWDVRGIHLVPYAGMGLHEIVEINETPTYETPEVFAVKMGVMFEFPFHSEYTNDKSTYGNNTSGSLWITLDYLNPWYERGFDATLTGEIFSLKVSFGLHEYTFKRVL